MPRHQIDRPAGVSIAAIVLGLMACLGLLFGALSIGALFLTHNPIIPKIASVRIFFVCFDLLTLAVVVWCFSTVVGLFQLKPWARFSIMAIGAMDLCFFAIQSVGLLVIRGKYDLSGLTIPNGSTTHPGLIQVPSVLLAIAAVDAVLALTGLWWLVYFNTQQVRLAFAAESRPV
jgi:hypothetical protein